MKIYKITLDLSLVISRFKKFNLYNYNLERPIIFIEAENADEACYLCFHKFCAMILKQDDSEETVLLLKDTLHDMSIKKVIHPK